MTRQYLQRGSLLANERRARIVDCVRSGMTLQATADTFGITRQRVDQILRRELGGGVRLFRTPLGRVGPIDRESRRVRRFWARVAPAAEGGCWLWTGIKYPTGYGSVGIRGASGYAHRVAYELTRGPIPAGLTIDHLCRNRGCVNPAHLEAVTSRTNTLRSPTALAAVNARKTHCKYGHPFAGDNLHVNSRGHRTCRICRAKSWREQYARKKAAA